MAPRKPPTAVDQMKAEALEALVFADNPGAIPKRTPAPRKPATKPATKKPATRKPVGERWEDTHQRATYYLPTDLVETIRAEAATRGVTGSALVVELLTEGLNL